MASAPMNPVSANLAHDAPNPVVQDEDLDNGPNQSSGDGDSPPPKKNRVETKKQRALKPNIAKGTRSQDAELQCLALNIYHEAGAEPYIGKQAVAAVTLNRVKSTSFPTSVCGVVKQRNNKSCQFSWVCQRPNAQPEKDSDAWQDALEITRPTGPSISTPPVSSRTGPGSTKRLPASVGISSTSRRKKPLDDQLVQPSRRKHLSSVGVGPSRLRTAPS